MQVRPGPRHRSPRLVPVKVAHPELLDMNDRTPTKPIRVILADDHPIVRAGIRDALKELPGVEVVGEANDGREAIELVKSHSPDVVFMDISMPGLNGLDATERIVKAFPQVRVIILSRHENEEYYWRALQVGASGYLLKKAAIAELKAALQRVAAGEIYLSREISNRLRNQAPLAANRPCPQPGRAIDRAPARDPPAHCRRPNHQGHRSDPENKRQDRGIPSRAS